MEKFTKNLLLHDICSRSCVFGDRLAVCHNYRTSYRINTHTNRIPNDHTHNKVCFFFAGTHPRGLHCKLEKFLCCVYKSNATSLIGRLGHILAAALHLINLFKCYRCIRINIQGFEVLFELSVTALSAVLKLEWTLVNLTSL